MSVLLSRGIRHLGLLREHPHSDILPRFALFIVDGFLSISDVFLLCGSTEHGAGH